MSVVVTKIIYRTMEEMAQQTEHVNEFERFVIVGRVLNWLFGSHYNAGLKFGENNLKEYEEMLK